MRVNNHLITEVSGSQQFIAMGRVNYLPLTLGVLCCWIIQGSKCNVTSVSMQLDVDAEYTNSAVKLFEKPHSSCKDVKVVKSSALTPLRTSIYSIPLEYKNISKPNTTLFNNITGSVNQESKEFPHKITKRSIHNHVKHIGKHILNFLFPEKSQKQKIHSPKKISDHSKLKEILDKYFNTETDSNFQKKPIGTHSVAANQINQEEKHNVQQKLGIINNSQTLHSAIIQMLNSKPKKIEERKETNRKKDLEMFVLLKKSHQLQTTVIRPQLQLKHTTLGPIPGSNAVKTTIPNTKSTYMLEDQTTVDGQDLVLNIYKASGLISTDDMNTSIFDLPTTPQSLVSGVVSPPASIPNTLNKPGFIKTPHKLNKHRPERRIPSYDMFMVLDGNELGDSKTSTTKVVSLMKPLEETINPTQTEKSSIHGVKSKIVSNGGSNVHQMSSHTVPYINNNTLDNSLHHIEQPTSTVPTTPQSHKLYVTLSSTDNIALPQLHTNKEPNKIYKTKPPIRNLALNKLMVFEENGSEIITTQSFPIVHQTEETSNKKLKTVSLNSFNSQSPNRHHNLLSLMSTTIQMNKSSEEIPTTKSDNEHDLLSKEQNNLFKVDLLPVQTTENMFSRLGTQTEVVSKIPSKYPNSNTRNQINMMSSIPTNQAVTDNLITGHQTINGVDGSTMMLVKHTLEVGLNSEHNSTLKNSMGSDLILSNEISNSLPRTTPSPLNDTPTTLASQTGNIYEDNVLSAPEVGQTINEYTTPSHQVMYGTEDTIRTQILHDYIFSTKHIPTLNNQEKSQFTQSKEISHSLPISTSRPLTAIPITSSDYQTKMSIRINTMPPTPNQILNNFIITSHHMNNSTDDPTVLDKQTTGIVFSSENHNVPNTLEGSDFISSNEKIPIMSRTTPNPLTLSSVPLTNNIHSNSQVNIISSTPSVNTISEHTTPSHNMIYETENNDITLDKQTLNSIFSSKRSSTPDISHRSEFNLSEAITNSLQSSTPSPLTFTQPTTLVPPTNNTNTNNRDNVMSSTQSVQTISDYTTPSHLMIYGTENNNMTVDNQTTSSIFSTEYISTLNLSDKSELKLSEELTNSLRRPIPSPLNFTQPTTLVPPTNNIHKNSQDNVISSTPSVQTISDYTTPSHKMIYETENNDMTVDKQSSNSIFNTEHISTPKLSAKPEFKLSEELANSLPSPRPRPLTFTQTPLVTPINNIHTNNVMSSTQSVQIISDYTTPRHHMIYETENNDMSLEKQTSNSIFSSEHSSTPDTSHRSELKISDEINNFLPTTSPLIFTQPTTLLHPTNNINTINQDNVMSSTQSVQTISDYTTPRHHMIYETENNDLTLDKQTSNSIFSTEYISTPSLSEKSEFKLSEELTNSLPSSTPSPLNFTQPTTLVPPTNNIHTNSRVNVMSSTPLVQTISDFTTPRHHMIYETENNDMTVDKQTSNSIFSTEHISTPSLSEKSEFKLSEALTNSLPSSTPSPLTFTEPTTLVTPTNNIHTNNRDNDMSSTQSVQTISDYTTPSHHMIYETENNDMTVDKQTSNSIFSSEHSSTPDISHRSKFKLSEEITNFLPTTSPLTFTQPTTLVLPTNNINTNNRDYVMSSTQSVQTISDYTTPRHHMIYKTENNDLTLDKQTSNSIFSTEYISTPSMSEKSEFKLSEELTNFLPRPTPSPLTFTHPTTLITPTNNIHTNNQDNVMSSTPLVQTISDFTTPRHYMIYETENNYMTVDKQTSNSIFSSEHSSTPDISHRSKLKISEEMTNFLPTTSPLTFTQPTTLVPPTNNIHTNNRDNVMSSTQSVQTISDYTTPRHHMIYETENNDLTLDKQTSNSIFSSEYISTPSLSEKSEFKLSDELTNFLPSSTPSPLNFTQPTTLITPTNNIHTNNQDNVMSSTPLVQTISDFTTPRHHMIYETENNDMTVDKQTSNSIFSSEHSYTPDISHRSKFKLSEEITNFLPTTSPLTFTQPTTLVPPTNNIHTNNRDNVMSSTQSVQTISDYTTPRHHMIYDTENNDLTLDKQTSNSIFSTEYISTPNLLDRSEFKLSEELTNSLPIPTPSPQTFTQPTTLISPTNNMHTNNQDNVMSSTTLVQTISDFTTPRHHMIYETENNDMTHETQTSNTIFSSEHSSTPDTSHRSELKISDEINNFLPTTSPLIFTQPTTLVPPTKNINTINQDNVMSSTQSVHTISDYTTPRHHMNYETENNDLTLDKQTSNSIFSSEYISTPSLSEKSEFKLSDELTNFLPSSTPSPLNFTQPTALITPTNNIHTNNQDNVMSSTPLVQTISDFTTPRHHMFYETENNDMTVDKQTSNSIFSSEHSYTPDISHRSKFKLSEEITNFLPTTSPLTFTQPTTLVLPTNNVNTDNRDNVMSSTQSVHAISDYITPSHHMNYETENNDMTLDKQTSNSIFSTEYISTPNLLDRSEFKLSEELTNSLLIPTPSPQTFTQPTTLISPTNNMHTNNQDNVMSSTTLVQTISDFTTPRHHMIYETENNDITHEKQTSNTIFSSEHSSTPDNSHRSELKISDEINNFLPTTSPLIFTQPTTLVPPTKNINTINQDNVMSSTQSVHTISDYTTPSHNMIYETENNDMTLEKQTSNSIFSSEHSSTPDISHRPKFKLSEEITNSLPSSTPNPLTFTQPTTWVPPTNNTNTNNRDNDMSSTQSVQTISDYTTPSHHMIYETENNDMTVDKQTSNSIFSSEHSSTPDISHRSKFKLSEEITNFLPTTSPLTFTQPTTLVLPTNNINTNNQDNVMSSTQSVHAISGYTTPRHHMIYETENNDMTVDKQTSNSIFSTEHISTPSLSEKSEFKLSEALTNSLLSPTPSPLTFTQHTTMISPTDNIHANNQDNVMSSTTFDQIISDFTTPRHHMIYETENNDMTVGKQTSNSIFSTESISTPNFSYWSKVKLSEDLNNSLPSSTSPLTFTQPTTLAPVVTPYTSSIYQTNNVYKSDEINMVSSILANKSVFDIITTIPQMFDESTIIIDEHPAKIDFNHENMSTSNIPDEHSTDIILNSEQISTSNIPMESDTLSKETSYIISNPFSSPLTVTPTTKLVPPNNDILTNKQENIMMTLPTIQNVNVYEITSPPEMYGNDQPKYTASHEFIFNPAYVSIPNVPSGYELKPNKEIIQSLLSTTTSSFPIAPTISSVLRTDNVHSKIPENNMTITPTSPGVNHYDTSHQIIYETNEPTIILDKKSPQPLSTTNIQDETEFTSDMKITVPRSTPSLFLFKSTTLPMNSNDKMYTKQHGNKMISIPKSEVDNNFKLTNNKMDYITDQHTTSASITSKQTPEMVLEVSTSNTLIGSDYTSNTEMGSLLTRFTEIPTPVATDSTVNSSSNVYSTIENIYTTPKLTSQMIYDNKRSSHEEFYYAVDNSTILPDKQTYAPNVHFDSEVWSENVTSKVMPTLEPSIVTLIPTPATVLPTNKVHENELTSKLSLTETADNYKSTSQQMNLDTQSPNLFLSVQDVSTSNSQTNHIFSSANAIQPFGTSAKYQKEGSLPDSANKGIDKTKLPFTIQSVNGYKTTNPRIFHNTDKSTVIDKLSPNLNQSNEFRILNTQTSSELRSDIVTDIFRGTQTPTSFSTVSSDAIISGNSITKNIPIINVFNDYRITNSPKLHKSDGYMKIPHTQSTMFISVSENFNMDKPISSEPTPEFTARPTVNLLENDKIHENDMTESPTNQITYETTHQQLYTTEIPVINDNVQSPELMTVSDEVPTLNMQKSPKNLPETTISSSSGMITSLRANSIDEKNNLAVHYNGTSEQSNLHFNTTHPQITLAPIVSTMIPGVQLPELSVTQKPDSSSTSFSIETFKESDTNLPILHSHSHEPEGIVFHNNESSIVYNSNKSELLSTTISPLNNKPELSTHSMKILPISTTEFSQYEDKVPFINKNSSNLYVRPDNYISKHSNITSPNPFKVKSTSSGDVKLSAIITHSPEIGFTLSTQAEELTSKLKLGIEDHQFKPILKKAPQNVIAQNIPQETEIITSHSTLPHEEHKTLNQISSNDRNLVQNITHDSINRSPSMPVKLTTSHITTHSYMDKELTKVITVNLVNNTNVVSTEDKKSAPSLILSTKTASLPVMRHTTEGPSNTYDAQASMDYRLSNLVPTSDNHLIGNSYKISGKNTNQIFKSNAVLPSVNDPIVSLPLFMDTKLENAQVKKNAPTDESNNKELLNNVVVLLHNLNKIETETNRIIGSEVNNMASNHYSDNRRKDVQHKELENIVQSSLLGTNHPESAQGPDHPISKWNQINDGSHNSETFGSGLNNQYQPVIGPSSGENMAGYNPSVNENVSGQLNMNLPYVYNHPINEASASKVLDHADLQENDPSLSYKVNLPGPYSAVATKADEMLDPTHQMAQVIPLPPPPIQDQTTGQISGAFQVGMPVAAPDFQNVNADLPGENTFPNFNNLASPLLGSGSYQNQPAAGGKQNSFIPYVYSKIVAGHVGSSYSQDGQMSISESLESQSVYDPESIKPSFMISPICKN